VTSSPRAGARKRRGRPRGNSDTRERILACARELFVRNGFDKTSVRAVATAAEVDSSLVHHYFGTKQQLFASAIRVPIDPMAVLKPVRETPVEHLGHVLPSLLVPLWDSEAGAALVATLRSLLTGSDVRLARSFLEEVITAEIAPRVDDPPGTGRLRVQFVASQLVGIVMARYIIGLEPFASVTPGQIADVVAPNLQRYLTGEWPVAPDVVSPAPAAAAGGPTGPMPSA